MRCSSVVHCKRSDKNLDMLNIGERFNDGVEGEPIVRRQSSCWWYKEPKGIWAIKV